MIRAIVIEDEHHGMELILRLIAENLPEVEVVGTGRTNADLIRLMEEEDHDPDVLLLDIQLPDGQVFQALEQIDTSDLQIIFTTAYDEYAINAFEQAAIHYLLKPMTKEKLHAAFNRIKRAESNPSHVTDNMNVQLEIARKSMELGPNSIEKTGIASVNGVRFVYFRDIVRLQGDDNYTTFIMSDGSHIVASRNIGYYKEHYEKHNFIKIHQSHIVNFNHLERYVRGDGGQIVMDNGDALPLARRNRPHFLERMKILADYEG